MATYKCKSCGGTYQDPLPDGMAYYHACPPEKITHAVFDAGGKLTSEEKREPFKNRRDENITPGLEYISFNGGPPKCMKLVSNPEERGQKIFVATTPSIISEGAGRELIE